MGINFPSHPPTGQKFPDPALPDLPVWQWNGTAWVQISGGAGGGGNVSNSGTPTSGQYARWVTGTTIEGIAPATVLGDIGAAPLASPTFTGDPRAPTPTAGDSDTSIATTAFVSGAIAGVATVPPATAAPIMDNVAAVGTATKYAREDHVHPSDTSRAALTQVVRYDAAQTLTAAQQKQARANIAVNDGNIIINGDFRINQIGYVSAAVLAAGAYGHDQWKAGASGGDYSFTQLKSSTQITIASGKSLIQPIEDANVVGGSYVLTWTGTAQARAGINTLTPSGGYAASPLLITGQTAGTVMSVEFNSGTLGAVKLESGATATPFIMRPYDQELSVCRRYWQNNIVCLELPGTAAGQIAAVSVDYAPPMRASPSITANTPFYSTNVGSTFAIASGTNSANGYGFQFSNFATGRAFWYGLITSDARL